MSTDDPTTSPHGTSPTAPDWGTPPGTRSARDPDRSAVPEKGRPSPDPGDGGEPDGGAPQGAAPTSPTPHAPGRTAVSWSLVAACVGVLLVVVVLATELVTAHRGWARVGAFLGVVGLAVVVLGAVAWRRSVRSVPGARRALVALLSGTVVVTAWVTVDLIPSGSTRGYSSGSSLYGYALGSGGRDEPAIGADGPDRVWFGESVRYDDGLVVSVSAPQPYTPTEYASEREGDHPYAVRLRVRVTNGTGEKVDPGGLDLQPVSGGLVARKVYDYAPDVLLDRPDEIARGTSAQWDLVYNVYDPQDLAVGIVPSWGSYDVAVFSR